LTPERRGGLDYAPVTGRWAVDRLAGAFWLVLLAGCASHGVRPAPSPAPPPAPGPAAATSPSSPQPDRAATLRVLELARSLLHTPYRRSGIGRDGVDCSGLTYWVFLRAGRELPRTTREQAAEGLWVALDDLRPGDLVFFGRDRRSLSHVGIVVSEPHEPLTMVHAASSLGVVETVVIDSPYWLGRLQLGRRVLAS